MDRTDQRIGNTTDQQNMADFKHQHTFSDVAVRLFSMVAGRIVGIAYSNSKQHAEWVVKNRGLESQKCTDGGMQTGNCLVAK